MKKAIIIISLVALGGWALLKNKEASPTGETEAEKQARLAAEAAARAADAAILQAYTKRFANENQGLFETLIDVEGMPRGGRFNGLYVTKDGVKGTYWIYKDKLIFIPIGSLKIEKEPSLKSTTTDSGTATGSGGGGGMVSVSGRKSFFMKK